MIFLFSITVSTAIEITQRLHTEMFRPQTVPAPKNMLIFPLFLSNPAPNTGGSLPAQITLVASLIYKPLIT